MIKNIMGRRMQAITSLTIIAFILPLAAFAGTTLPVQYDRQDSALSCEVAALKMALTYKGVHVSESTLMGFVGYDTTRPRGSTWGNPNKGFVGQLNGIQNRTGYGVHWYPIRRAARKFRSADAYSWMTIRDLTRELDRGNPIVIWGTNDNRSRYDPWHTANGTMIKAWYGEHTRLVIGYRGTASRPTKFIIMDPVRGRLVWTPTQLQANWSRFMNSGVVVR